jgi:hypothetical protein
MKALESKSLVLLRHHLKVLVGVQLLVSFPVRADVSLPRTG